jgi:hypothetical protein
MTTARLFKMPTTETEPDYSPVPREGYYYCLATDEKVLKHGISDTWPPAAYMIFKPHLDTAEQGAWKSLVSLWLVHNYREIFW